MIPNPSTFEQDAPEGALTPEMIRVTKARAAAQNRAAKAEWLASLPAPLDLGPPPERHRTPSEVPGKPRKARKPTRRTLTATERVEALVGLLVIVALFHAVTSGPRFNPSPTAPNPPPTCAQMLHSLDVDTSQDAGRAIEAQATARCNANPAAFSRCDDPARAWTATSLDHFATPSRVRAATAAFDACMGGTP